jgi:hypothetical protein
MATEMKARSVPSDITLDVLFARGARLRLELDLARREVALLRTLYAANYRGLLKGNTEGAPQGVSPAPTGGCYPGCFYYTDSCFRKDCRLNGNTEGTTP